MVRVINLVAPAAVLVIEADLVAAATLAEVAAAQALRVLMLHPATQVVTVV
jgi:hypothetical protein